MLRFRLPLEAKETPKPAKEKENKKGKARRPGARGPQGGPTRQVG